MKKIFSAQLIFALFIMCILFFNNIVTAQMSSGPLSGSVFTDDNVIGDYSFSSPANVNASDNNRASASAILSILTGDTHYLKASGFGFSIPSGCLIKGIFVEVEKSASNISLLATVVDNSVRLIKGGAIAGTNHSLSGTWPSSESYYSYGSASDLWGSGWTVADINSPDFGVAFSSSIVGIIGVFPSARIDHIRVTVYYEFIVVPLSIINFSATATNNHSAHLTWTTAGNDNEALIKIQRSSHGSDWTTLHEQQGKSTSTGKTFQYTDASCRDRTALYRLQVQHASGHITYSQVLRVNFFSLKLNLYPNPALDYVFIQYNEELKFVTCVGADGRQRALKYVQAGNGAYKVNIQSLPAGLYVLRVNESSGLFLKN